MPTTPNLHLPYPIADDPVNVPADIQALAAATDGIGIVPVGAVTMWLITAPPSGWLVCDGQEVDAATYPALAALFGVTGGLITIPDLRDRLPLGASPARPLRSLGGAANVALTGAQSGVAAHSHTLAAGGSHSHGISDPGHIHGYNDRSGAGSRGLNGQAGNQPEPFAFVNHTHAASFIATDKRGTGIVVVAGGSHSHAIANAAAANAAQSHENMPPYMALEFIMKAG
jgi:microcystin-dependent protein